MRRLVALLVVGLVGACAPGGDDVPVVLTVTPTTATFDERLAIRVAGLDAGQRVDIAARTMSGTGATWASSATFVADDDGRVDVPRDRPVAGSYRVADAMGLFWSMHLVSGDPEGGSYPPLDGTTVQLTVRSGGDVLARVEVERVVADPRVRPRRIELDEAGFLGEYYQPATTAPGPAVLYIGGSDGGIPPGLGPSLVGGRFPTLAVAYFGVPGLPAGLSDIPLEYFAGAARWLAAQPGVDPARLRVLGISRGAEAALLTAAAFPDVVHGVVAMSPTATIVAAYGQIDPGDSGWAWTLGGAPVQDTEAFALFDIPVELIDGPVLTLAGAEDPIWDAADGVTRIEQRLDEHAFPHPHEGLVYDRVGHVLRVPGSTPAEGPDRAVADAETDAWRRIFALLGS